MNTITIEFDGGTPCNIPRLGYGIGYGSYRLNGGDVVRVSHGRPMSNNVAEIWTLIEAVRYAKRTGKVDSLIIQGDSEIALKWALGFTAAGKPARHSKRANPDFVGATEELAMELLDIQVKTVWQPRKKSVEAFGH